MNNELYASFVISASIIATNGGSSDQTDPNKAGTYSASLAIARIGIHIISSAANPMIQMALDLRFFINKSSLNH